LLWNIATYQLALEAAKNNKSIMELVKDTVENYLTKVDLASVIAETVVTGKASEIGKDIPLGDTPLKVRFRFMFGMQKLDKSE